MGWRSCALQPSTAKQEGLKRDPACNEETGELNLRGDLQSLMFQKESYSYRPLKLQHSVCHDTTALHSFKRGISMLSFAIKSYVGP